MRRYAVLAALVLAAAPAAAQQKQSLQDAIPVAPAPMLLSEAPSEATPALRVSREQIDAQLETGRTTRAQMNQHDFLYIVAAVALGVIVAAVILD